ncbi:early light-induced protein 1, chloroplastic-like [Magnolia sinica]|uniref:early light-induced protein 1, chloroplastic-like n=1 Tax=Magnolia sinica TaxID=86752 RepID=UPI00265A0869|nr:early light-induced protein 1, chloroplastic-like [Magnolia sinica]
MATSAPLQFLVANSLIRANSKHVPRQLMARSTQVRCQVEDRSPAPSTPSKPGKIPQTPPPQTPSPDPKKGSTKFTDVLAFSGPGPEIINGRLAMVGFVSAIGVELAKGDGVVAQLANGGLPWFVGTTIVLSLASLIPLFKGVSPQSKSDGLMTSNAELWNGRFAMLGLVALVFTEYLTGGALV